MSALKITIVTRSKNVGKLLKNLKGSEPLSARTASIYTGLSLGYFRKLARNGIIPRHYLTSFLYYYTKRELDRYLKNKLLVKREKYFLRNSGNRYYVYFTANNQKERKG